MTEDQARTAVEDWFAARLDDPEECLGTKGALDDDFYVDVRPSSADRWAFTVRWREPFNREPIPARGHVLPDGTVQAEDSCAREQREARAKERQRARRAGTP